MNAKRRTIISLAVALVMVVAGLFAWLFTARSVKAAAETVGPQINHFGTVVPCGKDNGYKPNTKSSWNPWTMLTVPGLIMGLIPDGDPHRGWSLGSFYVEGFTGSTTSAHNAYCQNIPVYLKNAGDKVGFGFRLEQDIDRLNGDSSLVIEDDRKVIQDCWVDDPSVGGDFHRGVLIVVHTDYQGRQTINVYRDFLEGKCVGGNSGVELLEEGDYRVVLCYEIYKKTKWNWLKDWMDPNGSWFDYRIESYFSIRNSDAMVYPVEIGGGELSNKSCTQAGFRVDLNGAKYLKLSVKKEILNSDGTDIIEDVRFNKVVADKTEFTEEGKYTVRVENVYTGLTAEKTIYVGTNNVMRCNTVTGYSVDMIKSYLNSGYVIGCDGNLSVAAEPSVSTGSSVSSGTAAPTGASVPTDAPSPKPAPVSAQVQSAPQTAAADGKTDVWKVVAIVAISLFAIGAVAALVYKKVSG